MSKRLLALAMVLSMLLVLGLTGCQQTGTTTTTTANANTTTKAAGTTAAATEGATTAVAGDKTTTTAEATAPATWENLSWEKDTSPVTFSVYIDYDWYPVDTWGDEVAQEITRLTGVTLEVTKASDTTQLNVLLAAGSLSDFTYTDQVTQRFEDPDICYRWDELIAQYCPEEWDLIDPLEKINNQAADGHVYTLKTHYKDERDKNDERAVGNYGNFAMAYRSDVMNKLGLKMFASVEELDTTFYAVKEKAADVGITMIYNMHPSWSNPIANWMGLDVGNRWDAATKSVKMYYNDQGYLDYYKLLNKWYRDGILVSDCLGVRPEDFFSRNLSTQVFAFSYNYSIPAVQNAAWRDTGTGGKFDDLTKPVFELVYPALTYQGERRLSLTDYSTGWSSLFIAKSCKNPGRAICYAEFLKSPQGDSLANWGIEGKHYTLTEEGLPKNTDYVNNLDNVVAVTGITNWGFQTSAWAEGISYSSAKVNAKDQWEQHDRDVMQLNRIQHKKAIYDIPGNKNPAMSFARVESSDAEMAIQTKLADEWTKRTAEMITADSEAKCEQVYNDLMAYLTANGLAQLEAKYTENYVKNLKRYQDAGYFTDIVTN